MHTYARRNALVLSTIAAVALGACQGSDTPRGAREGGAPGAAPHDTAAGGMGGMGGMEGMPGMEGMEGMGGMQGMASGGMMSAMQAHMDSLHGADGSRLQRMLPMHRQMTANMLAAMNREMRSMNMSGDAGWTSLMDSVRQDLRHFPEMNASQLRSSMPAHRERMMRLMGMHREMMQDMNM